MADFSESHRNSMSAQDADHLRMLAIAFRVVGGLCALCVNIFWVHVIMGLTMLSNPGAWGKNPPPPFMGYVLSGFAFSAILFGWALGVCGFLVARNLEQRTKWTFCFVVTILYLLLQPLGTIVGVFALIVLLRPQVKAAFGRS